MARPVKQECRHALLFCIAQLFVNKRLKENQKILQKLGKNIDPGVSSFCDRGAQTKCPRKLWGYGIGRVGLFGSVKVNVLPGPGLFCTQIRPPCLSMTCLANASPSPVPSRSMARAFSAL